jgi:hypothetical protein
MMSTVFYFCEVIHMDVNDVVGCRFGKLHVDSYAGSDFYANEKKRRSFYNCTCDCGNHVKVCRKLLISGRQTTCCHCCRIESDNDHLRYVAENGDFFIFDTSDRQAIEKHCWYIDKYGYAIARIKEKNVRLTRYLLGIGDSNYVDHINGNPRDNRRCNLRVATPIQNIRNMRLPSHNSSGFKGVSYRKDRGKYRAYISLHDKTKHLGYYDTAEDAARAYDEAARFYFGNFACLNFPNKGEQGCLRNRMEDIV